LDETAVAGVARLADVPAALFIESQNHQHDLIRELALIDIGARSAATDPSLPRQVTRLIDDILTEYADVRSETRDQALSAMARGDEVFTMSVPVRPRMVDALRRWLQLIESADRFSDQGLLLTLAARPEIRSLRRWYVEAIAWCLAASSGERRVARYPDLPAVGSTGGGRPA
jgi:hypothetical protein